MSFQLSGGSAAVSDVKKVIEKANKMGISKRAQPGGIY